MTWTWTRCNAALPRALDALARKFGHVVRILWSSSTSLARTLANASNWCRCLSNSVTQKSRGASNTSSGVRHLLLRAKELYWIAYLKTGSKNAIKIQVIEYVLFWLIPSVQKEKEKRENLQWTRINWKRRGYASQVWLQSVAVMLNKWTGNERRDDHWPKLNPPWGALISVWNY